MISFVSKHFWVALLVVACFAVFLELGRMDVCTDNEGQRATPPAEMLRSNDFVVPTINGITYLAKPPLLYWAIAGVYSLTDEISALTARIPSALCAVGLVMAVYLVFRYRLGEYPARWAAFGLLASPYFLEHARWAQLDVPLTLATFLALSAAWTAFDVKCPFRRTYLTLIAGIALGAAIMLKGPAPLLFLAAVWASYLITRKELASKHLKRMGSLTVAALILEYVLKETEVFAFPFALVGAMVYVVLWAWVAAPESRMKVTAITLITVVLGALLATPWALAVLEAQGWDSIRKLLSSEVVTRTHTATEINSGSPFYYVLALPALLAPWAFLFPFQFSRSEWRENGQGYRFCIVTAWLSVLAFSLIAGKEYEYILPAFPFLVGATGVNLARIRSGQSPSWTRRWTARWAQVLVVFLGILAIGVIVYAAITNPHPMLLLELALLGVVVVASSIWALRNAGYRPHVVAVQTLLALLMGLLATRSFHYTGENSPREIAETTGRLLRNGYRVEAGLFRYPFTPAFAFYAQTPVSMQGNFDLVRDRLAGEAPYYYVVRKRDLEKGVFSLDSGSYEVLMGPHTGKEYLLIGNTPLPDAAVFRAESVPEK